LPKGGLKRNFEFWFNNCAEAAFSQGKVRVRNGFGGALFPTAT